MRIAHTKFHFLLAAGATMVAWAPSILLAAVTSPRVTLFPAEITISAFSVTAQRNGQVWLNWRLTSDPGSGRFLIQRQRPGALPEPVGTGMLRLRGEMDGDAEGEGVYRWLDPVAHEGDSFCYRLLYVPRGGTELALVEWEGIIGRARTEPTSLTVLSAGEAAVPLTASRPQSWIGTGPRVRPWSATGMADRVRLSLRTKGVFRVSAQELAEAGGWETATVTAAIAATNLVMSCQGEPVAWTADGDGLLFYGEPTDSLYAPENVYWVALGPGLGMALQTMPPPLVPVTNAWFMECLEFQGTSEGGSKLPQQRNE